MIEFIEVPLVWPKDKNKEIDYDEMGIVIEDDYSSENYVFDKGTIILQHIRAINHHDNPDWCITRIGSETITINIPYEAFINKLKKFSCISYSRF